MGVWWTQMKSFLKAIVSWIPVATRPNTVRYRMNSQNRFFLCRKCRNHIVTLDNRFGRSRGSVNGFLCRDAVNVRTDPISTHRVLFNSPVMNVRCNGCNGYLGEQFLTLDGDRPLPRVIERSYLLHADCLLYWDGTQVINAPLKERRLNRPTLSSPRMQILRLILVFYFITGFIFGFVLYFVS